MIHQIHLKFPAGRYGILYRFEKAGEGIPMHLHPPELQHDVTCTKGRVLVYGPNLTWRSLLSAGERFSFEDPNLPHEIQALEDGSVIFNEYLHGMPASYAQLPLSELDTFVTLGPLQHPGYA